MTKNQLTHLMYLFFIFILIPLTHSIINLTTDANITGKSGTYNFIVEIMDKYGIILNDTQKYVDNGNNFAVLSFPSELLQKNKFNYSIRINDINDNLLFRKFNVQSKDYSGFNKGLNITKITDENANNNLIRINLTVVSEKSEIKANVTVALKYLADIISKTEEKILANGMQTISIIFDNETIKSTHYNGSFIVDYAIIGNKMFDFEQSTLLYNYEDFAKTPYIKSITDEKLDLDNNSMFDFLELNFTTNAKEPKQFAIQYSLYDNFNSFILNGSKTQLLNSGINNMQVLINGSKIYKAKVNGPYAINAILQSDNKTNDVFYKTDAIKQSFYTDYEMPLLPDLKVSLNAVFNKASKETNLTVNISNAGKIPVFNIFLDIFSNSTYKNSRTLDFLDKNGFKIYNFIIANSTNATLFTAIADFDNLVDEIDKSNNIANSLKPEIKLPNDMDDDGISDDSDALIGNEKSINTTIKNLTVIIGNISNLSKTFNGTLKINFFENNSKILELDYNFKIPLNLSNLMMSKQSNSSFGYTIIKGLKLNGSTKTIYVDRIDQSKSGVCIKDSGISLLSEISENCNGTNETKLECDAILKNSYKCTYNATIKKYKVEGLNHSGIKQIEYTGNAGSTASSESSSGNIGASNNANAQCTEKWECTLWSGCINNMESRACTDISKCGTSLSKPAESRACYEITIKEKNGEKSEENFKKTENAEKLLNNKNDAKERKKYSLPDITGYFLMPPEAANKSIGALIALVIVVAGVIAYFKFVSSKNL
ncbi:hypothetical protein HYX01_01485 [Candidatus Woesearchaeota archaeon]|nr:hypothetical protein [Candidatus Woesearchaeota archaeon]